MDGSFSGFDIIRDSWMIGVGIFAVLLIGSFAFAVMADRKRSLETFQIGLSQAIPVPILVFLTWWCYRHPEQLDNRPGAWMYDMRWLWPFCGAFEIALLVLFVRSVMGGAGGKALRLMRKAHRLLAEGKVKEADAAYAKGRWILDHKCKDL